MSEKNTNTEPEVPALVKKAPELLPLWDWWVKEGRSTVTMLAVAGLAVAAFYGIRGWLRGRDAAANAALVKMASPEANGAGLIETQEEAENAYGSTKVGPKMRVVLAKSYFDEERYEDALKAYEALAKEAVSNPEIADIAQVGRAYALEGIASIEEKKEDQPAKYKAAQEAFEAYASNAANSNSYLLLDAKLGAARCKALAGDKEGAAKDFDALTNEAKDEAVKARIKRVADAAKRFKPRERASLFDAANAAAAQVTAPAKPDAPAKPEAKAPAAPAAPAKPEAKAPAAPAKPATPAVKPEAKVPAAPVAPAKPESPAPAPAKPAAK